MFVLQYNRNTFNPKSRKDWREITQYETRELCEARLKEDKRVFRKEFGYATPIQYRVIELGE